MKKVLLAIALVANVFAAQAQTDYSDRTAPYWFIGLQGGAATTFQRNYDALDMIVPTASVQFGRMFSPVVGARLHANGMWQKAGRGLYGLCDPYDTKYVNGDIDALINLSTLFGSKDYYKFNVFAIGGLGYRHMWDDADNALTPVSYFGKADDVTKDNLNAINQRIGLAAVYNIAKHWSLGLEVDWNHWNNTYEQIANNQLTAQLGLTYKFGFKKKKVEEPVQEVVPEPAPAPKPEPKPVVKPEPKPEPKPYVAPKAKENITKNIFFRINKWDSVESETKKVKEAADWMKAHETATAIVTGYADKGTGTTAINKKLAENRATAVAKKLKEYGISPDRISVASKGDTVQPFANNDDNRVVIIEAAEK